MPVAGENHKDYPQNQLHVEGKARAEFTCIFND